MIKPKPLTTDNIFAHQTMAERLPGIVRNVQKENPQYPAAIQKALEQLYEGMVGNALIPMLEKDPIAPPDYERWEKSYRTQRQKFEPLTWQHNEWFFAETFGFRHIIQAVRWYENRHDPYAMKKQAELKNSGVWKMVEAALTFDGTYSDRMYRLLAFALWGNRVDLSHPAGQLVGEAAADELLVDDRERVVAHLNPKGGVIHLVADNVGTELILDLALIDLLLTQGQNRAVLHVKCYPTYVSDTTTDDVWQTLQAMENQGGRIGAVGQRVRKAWEQRRLVLAADPFWVSSSFLWEMPQSLKETLARAQLVILKGDMNYRRAVGDTIWGEGESFEGIMAYFPAPMVALRSLKCDALVGVPREVTRKLDAISEMWRTTGRYGVIQFAHSQSEL